MKRINTLLEAVIGLCIITAIAGAPVYAETVVCKAITSLPYTIESQGTYCLTRNLATSITSGNAITINAHNVVLDLNGYVISGLDAGKGTHAHGVYGHQRKNITIRNGTVRGFMCGIWLDDDPPHTTSEGHVIENIRADANTYAGIKVVGCKNTLCNNKVISTGGSTYGSVNSARGILVFGPGNKIINNDIFDTKEQTSGHTFGVLVSGSIDALVEGNRIENSALGKGMSYGIYIITSDNVLVKNNRISKMNFGVYYSGSTVKYGDNLITDVTTPYMSDTHIEK